MNAVWTRLRRLVTSIMLVAMASFALHGGAMAGLHGHAPSAAECSKTPSGSHHHQTASRGLSVVEIGHPAHEHGHAHHHSVTAEIEGPQTGSLGQLVSAQIEQALAAAHPAQTGDHSDAGPCCAGACAVVLSSLAPGALSAPMIVAAPLLPAAQDGTGRSLDGLKRPPRTPSIA